MRPSVTCCAQAPQVSPSGRQGGAHSWKACQRSASHAVSKGFPALVSFPCASESSAGDIMVESLGMEALASALKVVAPSGIY